MERQQIIDALSRYENVVFRHPSQGVSYAQLEDKFYHRVQGTSVHEVLLDRELSGCYIASCADVDQALTEEEEQRFERQLGAYLS